MNGSFSEMWRNYIALHRRPRTTNERRANQTGRRIELEIGRWHRGKRSMRSLPNAWDNVLICKQHWAKRKSWKLSRRHQWQEHTT